MGTAGNRSLFARTRGRPVLLKLAVEDLQQKMGSEFPERISIVISRSGPAVTSDLRAVGHRAVSARRKLFDWDGFEKSSPRNDP